MRKLGTVISAIFFLMAGALGWFLPLAAFNFEDKISDRRQTALDIEQINLSYRDDLAMNQKINLVNYETNITELIQLDKGVSNSKDDIQRILNEFMADFTGYNHQVRYSSYATPMLAKLSNNRGTIVIWSVSCKVTDDWFFECYIDDKTGAILRCGFISEATNWEGLIKDALKSSEVSKAITEKLSNALYNHYQRQLSAKLVTYRKVQEQPEIGMVGYRIVFRDAKNYTFQVTVNVNIAEGRIESF